MYLDAVPVIFMSIFVSCFLSFLIVIVAFAVSPIDNS